MGIHVDASEVRELARDLAEAPGKIRRRAPEAIRKTALSIERSAKSIVPVETGLLRSSIGSDIGALSATIGTDLRYAHFVEWGTSEMAPQPYMRPAFDRNIGKLEQELGDACEDIL